jgi:hypothetical protein
MGLRAVEPIASGDREDHPRDLYAVQACGTKMRLIVKKIKRDHDSIKPTRSAHAHFIKPFYKELSLFMMTNITNSTLQQMPSRV